MSSVTIDGAKVAKQRRLPGRKKEGKKGRLTARQKRDLRAALLFISPWLIGFVIFTAWPMICSLFLSFTDYDNYNPPQWVGWDNYVQMFSDPKVSKALWNTFIYAIIQVPVYVILALAVALLLNQVQRCQGFFRTVFYLPKMVPQVAIGVLFLLLFNGQTGIINTVLGWFGIRGPMWTTDPHYQKLGLIILSFWTLGSSVVILLAARKDVPVEMYESARIDGASGWRQFVSISLPMMSSRIFFIFIVNSIAAWQMFTEAYTAFWGGGSSTSTYSSDSTLFYVIYLFQQAFEDFHMGYASALAWLLFIIIMIITGIQMLLSKRFVYYEGEDQ